MEPRIFGTPFFRTVSGYLDSLGSQTKGALLYKRLKLAAKGKYGDTASLLPAVPWGYYLGRGGRRRGAGGGSRHEPRSSTPFFYNIS